MADCLYGVVAGQVLRHGVYQDDQLLRVSDMDQHVARADRAETPPSRR